MKKNNAIKFVITVILCFTMFGITACGGSNKLVGEWKADEEETTDFPKEMCMFSDGTGTSNEYRMEWLAENGKMRLTVTDDYWFETQIFMYDYKLSGKTLTLTLSDGSKSMKYTKK